MQAVVLLIGLYMLGLGIALGLFHKVEYISPANSPLFARLSPVTKKRLGRRFCVVPLICGVSLIAYGGASLMGWVPQHWEWPLLVVLLALTLFDYRRTNIVLTKLRVKGYPEQDL